MLQETSSYWLVDVMAFTFFTKSMIRFGTIKGVSKKQKLWWQVREDQAYQSSRP